MSLPNIQKNIVDCLLSGVREGLVYVTLVEESINITYDQISIQKASKNLRLEVEVYHKWLGNKLPKYAPKANTAGQILQWLRHTGQVSQEELFAELLSMIADILAVCLTNLPQVIAMKCHTSVIEKREASVYAAAQLLGETMQIINTLQDRELPSLNPNDMAFIDKWRSYLKDPFP
ncbi:unnamed protein product [Lactuca virosa]|uniref:Uncharacterized protein n=1 Tax=Lactuca virosa TaxID=75947 RepID=A0AAU9M801_9ASTR|nr:unnamed protein product [Lactuca virosa]